MIKNAFDIVEQYPVRKGYKKKQAFREDIQAYFQNLGYRCTVEKGNFGVRNVICGDPEQAKYIVAAHYDTCAKLPFPNYITPCNLWLYLGYQLLIVAGFLGITALVGGAIGFLTRDSYAGGFSGLVVYWGLLLLMLVGPANRNNANDNTSGVITVLQLAEQLPAEYRDRVCFVLFDLEEAGLLGSAEYQQKHKLHTKDQIVFNFDCVGDGDEILLIPSRKVKKDLALMECLRSICGDSGNKKLYIREKGITIYPSDQANFPRSVGIAAFRRSKWAGLYLDRIHTKKDTVLDKENVAMLCKSLLQCIADMADKIQEEN